MSAVLIRVEPQWRYLGPQVPGSRHLVVWRIGVRHVVAIVTETTEESGPGIAHMAEQVADQLAIDYPGELVEQIEHRPEPRGDLAAEFEQATVDRGVVSWRAVPADELEKRLGADFQAAWSR